MITYIEMNDLQLKGKQENSTINPVIQERKFDQSQSFLPQKS